MIIASEQGGNYTLPQTFNNFANLKSNSHLAQPLMQLRVICISIRKIIYIYNIYIYIYIYIYLCMYRHVAITMWFCHKQSTIMLMVSQIVT